MATARDLGPRGVPAAVVVPGRGRRSHVDFAAVGGDGVDGQDVEGDDQ
jgi:hypothetical protein